MTRPYVCEPDDFPAILAALVRRPGLSAEELGGSYVFAARLRQMGAAGLVEGTGKSPKRWYATLAGSAVVNREKLAAIQEGARAARRDALARIARAESVAAFAETMLSASSTIAAANAAGRNERSDSTNNGRRRAPRRRREPPSSPNETLNQPGPARAKLAPVRPRFVRFQAVSGGNDARLRRPTHAPNPAQPCGKRLN